MSKKNLTRREALRAARSRRKLVSRIFTIAIVVVLIGIVIWMVINSQKQTTPAAGPTNGGATPYLVGTKQYSSAPPFTLDLTKQYFAVVTMAKGGEFTIQLYPDKAPITVNSFVFLARQGFFDGVTFHRVISGFMAQGGDPDGTGMGGPGYEFNNEQNDLTFDKAGVVAMANAGLNTNGSQFFITFGPVGLSESDYTIFGQVISGMDVVNGITLRDPNQNPTFSGDVIENITINEN
jgi:peptidylprolyl isomerase